MFGIQNNKQTAISGPPLIVLSSHGTFQLTKKFIKVFVTEHYCVECKCKTLKDETWF